MGFAFSPMRAVVLASLLISTVPACSMAGTQGNPVLIHRKVGSKPCELVQHGSFMLGKDFAWVEIEGEKGQLYSPELGKGDYLTGPPEISALGAKEIHKSGFELRPESPISGDIPLVRSLREKSSCPDLQSAIAEVEQSRALRRSKVQAKIYQPGIDKVLAPTQLDSGPSATPSTPASGTEVKHRVTYHGTVELNIVIGIDGNVEQIQIVRSSTPHLDNLDKKATEKAAGWKFLPARKAGLPVRCLVPVVFNFDLY